MQRIFGQKDFIMDWPSQVVELIKQHFRKFGIIYHPGRDVHSCLVDFMNLDLKLVKPIPRKVYKSKTFKSRLIPPSYQHAISYIENKINNGHDITFHQSKKTLDPSFNDLLLNDWIIQHLHVSNTKSQQNQRFYDRSKYLLFVAFSIKQAFFIDVRLHNEPYVFARKELLEIIDNNWPQLFKDNVIEDGFFTSEHTDEQISTLRNRGYTIGTTKVNDKIVINPGLGITTSGHNIHVVRRANSVLKMLHDAFYEIETDAENIKKDLSSEVGFVINQLDVEIRKLTEWPYFAFYEKTSNCYIQKDYSRSQII
ncbi:MAG TPA: hypothetical protein VGD40_16405 [Chryseosolibacter sp.]